VTFDRYGVVLTQLINDLLNKLGSVEAMFCEMKRLLDNFESAHAPRARIE
jgi:hypothetical protein